MIHSEITNLRIVCVYIHKVTAGRGHGIEETRQKGRANFLPLVPMGASPAYVSRRIPASPAFGEVFSHFYLAENKGPGTITQTLLPSFQVIMVFSFGTPVSLLTQQKKAVYVDTCLVAGPIKQAFDYTLPPGAEILVANFKDDAFFRFFGVASMEQAFTGHPDQLLRDNCFIELWSRLRKFGNEKRIRHILDFCQPYIRDRSDIARQIADFTDFRLNPVKEISGKYEVSERTVQISHKKQFGFSAKEIARYQRFLKAIRMIQQLSCTASGVDWFEVIHTCGFYDQSQLIHDFKHYLHISPTKYLQLQQSICNPTS